MKRIIVPITAIILIALMYTSAASLQVNAGVIQAFELMGDALNLPDFTKGLHRLSTHYRFNQQGATCDAEAGTLWVDIRNNGDGAGEQANLELWYFGEASGLGSEPELVQVNEITLPDPKTEQRYEMTGIQRSGHYRFHLDFADATADGDPNDDNGQGQDWSGVVSLDAEMCLTPEAASDALRASGPTTIAIESLSASGAANEDGSLTASGQVCAANTGTAPTEGLWIYVKVEEAGDAQTPASFAAEELPAPPPAEMIEEGAEQPWRHCYDYAVSFTPVEGVEAYTAAATVLINNHADAEEPGGYGPSTTMGFTVDGLIEAEATEDVTQTPTPTPTGTPEAEPTEEITPTPEPEDAPPAADAPPADAPTAPTDEPTPVPTPTEDKGDINHAATEGAVTPTEPPAPTDPPATDPPATEPPATESTATEPPPADEGGGAEATEPPATTTEPAS